MIYSQIDSIASIYLLFTIILTFMRSFVVQPANKLRLFLCGYNVLTSFSCSIFHSFCPPVSVFKYTFIATATLRVSELCVFMCGIYLYKFAHQIAMIGTKEWRNWMNFSTVITTHYLEPIVSVFLFFSVCLSLHLNMPAHVPIVLNCRFSHCARE